MRYSNKGNKVTTPSDHSNALDFGVKVKSEKLPHFKFPCGLNNFPFFQLGALVPGLADTEVKSFPYWHIGN